MGEGSIMSKLAAALLITSAASSVFGGLSSIRSANDEAKAQRRQADLAAQESAQEAERIKRIRKAELATNSMRFIKGGVTLQGSPLFMLETQDFLDKQEVESIKRSGYASYKLGYQRAAITQNKGRAAFVGGIGQAAGTLSGI